MLDTHWLKQFTHEALQALKELADDRRSVRLLDEPASRTGLDLRALAVRKGYGIVGQFADKDVSGATVVGLDVHKDTIAVS